MSALTVIIGPAGVTCPHCHARAPMSRCGQFLIGHARCHPDDRVAAAMDPAAARVVRARLRLGGSRRRR